MAYDGFSLLAPDGLESKSMIKRHVDKFRRRVWLHRVCYGLVLVGLAALVALVGFQPNRSPSDRSLLSLPAAMRPNSWPGETKDGTAMFIEDVISMGSEVLVLVRKSPSSGFPSKRSLECRYGDDRRFTYGRATALHLYDQRAAILCPAPPQAVPWDANSILIAVGQDREIRPKVTVHRRPLQWFQSGEVAYEAFPTETDVVVFVHGINHMRGVHLSAIKEKTRLKGFRCVYGGYFETKVTAQAQEVFRCAHPPVDLVEQFAGRRISVKLQGRVLPSVAYYNPRFNPRERTRSGSVDRKLLGAASESSAPKHHVCSCTMIYNGAKFLKEWVYYNSHLGVEKFFLYDNNSDDDLDEVIGALGRGGFNIQKQAWPWVKTQEAGFSHCSLLAQNECKWMLFTDVDEFLVPGKRFLNNASSGDEAVAEEPAEISWAPAGTISPAEGILRGVGNSSILAGFIRAATAGRGRVGQISTFCHNFGPSGLTATPPRGVTQGYTCRMRKTERHKSIVLLSSIESSLENVIHHFVLKRGYGQKVVRPGTAVINHYKFQAWDEFKTKFHRRAATYVVDWTEDRNHESKDRVPDLGTKAIKPGDWESRYCEVHDYGLRNYTRRIFGRYDRDNSLHLPWE